LSSTQLQALVSHDQLTVALLSHSSGIALLDDTGTQVCDDEALIEQYTEMSIQHYEHSFVDPIAYGSENIQSTVYDSHGGYGNVDFGNLNIHDDDTNGVNKTQQYHVVTTASTSTATLDTVIYLNPLFHPEVY